ncbi:MAG: response regulator [Ktedonobacterales bacterium]|nr:response regulator [Ktedonobacterales bacterium]
MAFANAAYTVLIVDDNPALLDLIAESLKMIGNYAVVTATNGVEGLERFYEVRPQCMVIDVKMPQLDGYQLVRILRGDPETAATPLVILTAMVQDKDRFQGLASGADQYLLKPIKPRELVDAIQRAITTSAETRSAALRRLAEEEA